MADAPFDQDVTAPPCRWVDGFEAPLENPLRSEAGVPPQSSPLSPTITRSVPGRFIELSAAAEIPTTTRDAELGDAFELLQAFDGTVESVDGDDVVVTLRDLTDPARPDEEAVLSIQQFDYPRRVAAGTAFYLTIGYRERRSGRELVTLAQVRTIVPLTAAQRSRAMREARALRRVLQADE